jgi:AraC-like DNA-binding protein
MTQQQTADATHRTTVGRVIGSMHDNLNTGMSLHDMADVAAMSPFHFDRVFRSVTGMPPCAFQGALRLCAAKRALLLSPASVTDVCFDVGYSSLGTFITRFTERVGVSPRQFRRLAGPRDRARDLAWLVNPRARPAPADRSVVTGTVRAEPGFTGVVFVGLFPDAAPDSPPQSCTLLTGTGSYSLPMPASGRWHVLALAADLAALNGPLIEEHLARASAGPIASGGDPRTVVADLVLRPPAVTDLPVLVSTAVLMARASAMRGGPALRQPPRRDAV